MSGTNVMIYCCVAAVVLGAVVIFGPSDPDPEVILPAAENIGDPDLRGNLEFLNEAGVVLMEADPEWERFRWAGVGELEVMGCIFSIDPEVGGIFVRPAPDEECNITYDDPPEPPE